MAAMAAVTRTMTRNKQIGPALLATLVLTLAAGCAKPAEGYTLVSRQTAQADGGRFAFNIDLDDESLVYDTQVAARVNAARLPEPTLELQMNVISPTGQTAIERITFPLKDAAGQISSSRQTGSVRDFLWPWREQIRVSGPDLGHWNVVITLPDTTLWSAVEGIGLSYHGTKWEKAN